MFTVDLTSADIVTMYLLPQINVKLIPQLCALHPGARVVSHDFAIAGVIPDRVIQDYLPRLNLYKTYFLYTAPLRRQTTFSACSTAAVLPPVAGHHCRALIDRSDS